MRMLLILTVSVFLLTGYDCVHPDRQPFVLAQFHDTTGWIIGRESYKTVDDGISWNKIPVPNIHPDYDPASLSRHIIFFDTTFGLTSLGGGLQRTLDGGESWSAPRKGAFGRLFLRDPLFGINCAADECYRTIDGGTTWSPLILKRRFYDVCFFDTDHIYAAVGSRLMVSGDQGLSWSIAYKFPEKIFRVKRWKDAIWVVGSDALIATYVPAEGTALIKHHADASHLFDIGFLGQTAVAVGTSGIWVSTDGLQTWRKDNPYQSTFVSIAFSRRGIAYVVGGNQTPLYGISPSRIALKSADLRHWEPITFSKGR